jgi:hypothetical protein
MIDEHLLTCYLFICSLLYDTANVVDYIAFNVRMIDE